MNTLFDKIWDSHVVQVVEDGPTQLYIDRLYCHEVTSPQAFEGLRNRSLKCFRPEISSACQIIMCKPMIKINPLEDAIGRKQIDTLDANCKEFGLTEFKMNTRDNGIIHVVGPERVYHSQE